MLRLSIIIFRACTTGYPRRGKIFFINKLTLITRKAKVLLLANANVFFSITCIARLVNLIETVQHFKHLVMFGITGTGCGA